MAYRRKSPEEKLAEIEEQERQLAARKRQAKAQISQTKRKADTRRKVIAGALALEHQDPSFKATLQRLLNEHVTRPEDRALFDLPERLPTKESEPSA